MSLEIKSVAEIGNKIWNDFCYNSSSAWFQHTTFLIDYTLNLFFEKSSICHSFGILENNKLIAIAPLIKKKIQGDSTKSELTVYDWNTPYPAFSNFLSKNKIKKIEKIIFDKIFQITNIDYINYFVSPLSNDSLNKIVTVNPLSKFGFHDISISTNILELNKDEKLLFRNITRGHQRNIKAAKKDDCKIEIIDSKNFHKDKFDLYRQFHFKAAGRLTRPNESWEFMQRWIKKDLAILALVKKNDVYVSATFVITYKKKAYYLSGATLPDYNKQKGIGHLTQWEIIKYLNFNGFTHYEIGRNWYPNISQEVADEKMLGISRFKAGFGADKYPLFRGEYFYNKEYMKKVSAERIENFFQAKK